MLYYEVRRVPTPKWMLPRVCFVLTDIASPVDQTGEAFLFLLVSLIEKGKKRYNQTSKGNEQAQNTYNYRNNLKSRHYNAPPFLCNPVFWYKFGRLPPCHGHSNACFHAYLEYHISHVYSTANRIFVRFILSFKHTKTAESLRSRRSPFPNLS